MYTTHKGHMQYCKRGLLCGGFVLRDSRACVRVGSDSSVNFEVNIFSKEEVLMSPWLWNVSTRRS